MCICLAVITGLFERLDRDGSGWIAVEALKRLAEDHQLTAGNGHEGRSSSTAALPGRDAPGRTPMHTPGQDGQVGRETFVEMLPLLFDHLDSRIAAGASSTTTTSDGKLQLDEWVGGLAELMAQRNDRDFKSFCDGMMARLEGAFE